MSITLITIAGSVSDSQLDNVVYQVATCPSQHASEYWFDCQNSPRRKFFAGRDQSLSIRDGVGFKEWLELTYR